jgi:hypothetical protein
MSINSSRHRSAFEPETIQFLQEIFDGCLLRLSLVRRTNHSSHLRVEELLAKRIITAAQQGIETREQIEALALDGLLLQTPTRREGRTFEWNVEGERKN